MISTQTVVCVTTPRGDNVEEQSYAEARTLAQMPFAIGLVAHTNGALSVYHAACPARSLLPWHLGAPAREIDKAMQGV